MDFKPQPASFENLKCSCSYDLFQIVYKSQPAPSGPHFKWMTDSAQHSLLRKMLAKLTDNKEMCHVNVWSQECNNVFSRMGNQLFPSNDCIRNLECLYWGNVISLIWLLFVIFKLLYVQEVVVNKKLVQLVFNVTVCYSYYYYTTITNNGKVSENIKWKHIGDNKAKIDNNKKSGAYNLNCGSYLKAYMGRTLKNCGVQSVEHSRNLKKIQNWFLIY